MGRARITLKPISNERSRKSTFKTRKEGLITKISQLSTMCGVEACLIVYDDINGDVGAVTWPENPTLVRPIIENYERQRAEKPPKTFVIQDFFENRKNMVEAEISKLHKQAREIKYPTWDPSLSNMEKEQLSAFIANVNAKIEACDQRIHIKSMQNMAKESASSSHSSQLNFMQNISQSQMIPTYVEPLLNDNNNGRVLNSTNQVGGASSHGVSMLRNIQQGDVCVSYMPSMSQSQMIALETFKSLKGKNKMVDFTNQVVVPLDSTNHQLGESLDWANHHGSFDWANGPIGIEDWSNPLNGDLVGSQPDESVLQNIPIQSQNDYQGAVLPTLPLSLDGFQTDCRNMFFRMSNSK